jgi:hypothetical protein
MVLVEISLLVGYCFVVLAIVIVSRLVVAQASRNWTRRNRRQ